MPGQRKESFCIDCQGKKLLPLGKGDFLECPTCGGTGIFVCYEQVITPSKVFIMGGGK